MALRCHQILEAEFEKGRNVPDYQPADCHLEADHVPLVDSDAGILSVRTKSTQEPPDHPREVADRENPDETESADVEEVGVGVLLVLHLLQPAHSPACVGRELVELVQDDANRRDQA